MIRRSFLKSAMAAVVLGLTTALPTLAAPAAELTALPSQRWILYIFDKHPSKYDDEGYPLYGMNYRCFRAHDKQDAVEIGSMFPDFQPRDGQVVRYVQAPRSIRLRRSGSNAQSRPSPWRSPPWLDVDI